MIAYVGTYTIGSDSDGIYRFDYDESTGRLSHGTLVATTDNPSFLAIDHKKRLLLSVNETGDFNGAPTGGFSSFRISESFGLKHCGTVPSEGQAPCYVSTTGDLAFVANYVSGTVSEFRIDASGSLHLLTIAAHKGRGPNLGRQESAHAHSIVPHPIGPFVVAADLGTDELIVYERAGEGLIRRSVVKESPGAGPRHSSFTKNGDRLLLLNELNSTLSLFRCDPLSGYLEKITSASTLPDGWSGDNICADVHLSPDERVVYCSNRGHESLTVFRLDHTTDTLECIQTIACGGEHPRNFAISPDGRFLLCANQNSHNIRTFGIDPESGKLAPTDHVAEIPMPVCVILVDEDDLR